MSFSGSDVSGVSDDEHDEPPPMNVDNDSDSSSDDDSSPGKCSIRAKKQRVHLQHRPIHVELSA